MAEASEEFWNDTSKSAFNFDDDNEQDKILPSALDVFELDKLFISLGDSGISTLPMNSIITKSNFDIILWDTNVTRFSKITPVEETILKMFLGKPYVLSEYRSIDQKLQLLDEALLTKDGNIIIMVVLHLRKSLQLSKFYYHLAPRKVAVQHYSNYLMKKFNVEELYKLHMSINNSVNIAYLFYMDIKSTLNNKDKTLYVLTKFIAKFRHDFDRDKKMLLKDFQKFINWQIKYNFSSNSLTEQIVELWQKDSGKKIDELRQLVKLDDLQYEWVMLNVLSGLQMWPKLIEIFIKPNLLLQNRFKSVMNIKFFIDVLYKHNPPKAVLSQFLGCMANVEESVKLARKMSCYKYTIDCYVAQADRLSLKELIKGMSPNNEVCNYAKSKLESSEIRWKN